jgi:hypothetical protein
MLLINGNPLDLLHPGEVHKLRTYMAHFLLSNPTTFGINTLLTQKRRRGIGTPETSTNTIQSTTTLPLQLLLDTLLHSTLD